jgi:hypothetical protein
MAPCRASEPGPPALLLSGGDWGASAVIVSCRQPPQVRDRVPHAEDVSGSTDNSRSSRRPEMQLPTNPETGDFFRSTTVALAYRIGKSAYQIERGPPAAGGCSLWVQATQSYRSSFPPT